MGHSPRFGFSRLLLGFRRWPFVGTRGRWGTLLLIVGIFSAAHAQTQPPPAKNEVQFSTVAIPASLPPDVATTSQGNLPPGPGLTIIPTFDASIDAATQTVINNAITYFEHTIVSNITVHIYYYNMDSGLGQSTFFIFNIPYTSYRTALGNNATSPDDATALNNTATVSNNPVNANSDIGVKVPTGMALGLGTSEQSFNFLGSPCPTFTGSGCIGLNLTLANQNNDLTAVVEHEMDEVLSLGSALTGDTTPAVPWVQDLFRWTSSGVRSYSANPSNTVPCSSTPVAYFAIDGGNTDLNQFNNCDNGGDYGDWVEHTPSQVQDAFTNFSASPSLNVRSPEVRTLDVSGFNIAFRNFAEISVWRPLSGQWFIIPNDNPGTQVVQSWGLNGDVPVRGDFDGDGITDISVWRPSSGQWFIIPSSNAGSPIIQSWGLNSDIPVPGDYDGDGKTDFAVWRPSTGQWFIIPSSNPGTPIVQSWGLNGDIPVPGDYDGDRKTDVAVFRPSNGTWYIIPSNNPGSPIVQSWGLNGDKPTPGDYDGDGKADFAVWRPSTGQWFIIPSSNPGTPIVQSWGLNGDIPVPGDYDGDGKTDFAVWRPSTGQWLVIPSATPMAPTLTSWGLPGDIPVQKPTGQ
jgi:hypothetical protein